MGLYMNDFGEKHHRKVDVLMQDHGAEVILPEFINPKTGKIALFVLHHLNWDAVCIIVDKKEYDDSVEYMNRIQHNRSPVTWLSIDVETANKFAPNLAKYLEPGVLKEKSK